jgi:hypothetical protein
MPAGCSLLQPNPKQKEIVHEQAVVPDRRRRPGPVPGRGALASAKTAQQEKMSTCNAQAAGKKGDERKAFMKGCPSAAARRRPATQQENEGLQQGGCRQEGRRGKAFMSDWVAD